MHLRLYRELKSTHISSSNQKKAARNSYILLMIHVNVVLRREYIYVYNLSHVLAYLTIKSVLDSDIIFFSFMICSCCRVSTMWCFFMIFKANVRLSSLFIWTCNKRDTYSSNYHWRLSRRHRNQCRHSVRHQ